jgi:hypothetical protein
MHEQLGDQEFQKHFREQLPGLLENVAEGSWDNVRR